MTIVRAWPFAAALLATLAITGALASADPAQRVFHEKDCDPDLVICLDPYGALRAKDHWPRSVRVGDRLTVLVVTRAAALDGPAITVRFQGRPSLEIAFAPPVEGEPTAREVQVEHRGELAQALVFTSATVADDAVDFVVAFHRELPNEPLIDFAHVISVDLGYSYYSVALLVAATFKGDRRVLRDLDTTSDHAVDPALALNIFPGGRQRGVLGYLRRCAIVAWYRCLANNLGLQLGAGLDLTRPTDRLYAGLTFEPVAGLAFGGGVSLRKVAVVPPAGALPAVVPADGAPPSDSRYVVRGYVGVTLTLDLVNTLSSLGGRIKQIVLPDS